jgi:DNA-binding transcriptional LysR family regulator
MNDRQLRYALTVWRERSFSKAAPRLNISQPAISDQIRQLEEELGFELFRRTGRGVEATYVGRTFLQHAERAMVGMLGLADTARQLRGEGPRGAFSIGFSSGVAREMLPRVMATLGLALPRVRLTVVTATTRRIHRMVLERRLDAGLAIEADPQSIPAELISERVASSEAVLVLAAGHPLSRRAGVAIADIKDERIIINEPDIGYGQFVQSIFADNGVLPNIAARVDHVETVKLMVASGIGLAILPRCSVENEVALKQLRIVSLKPRREVPITLVRHPDALSPAAASCFDLVHNALRSDRPTPIPATTNLIPVAS